jgi:hypothetical protein
MITRNGMRVTHKGWFWFCPVWLSFAPDDSGFGMEERWIWLVPIFWICMQLEILRIFLTDILTPDFVPEFGVFVTGEVRS